KWPLSPWSRTCSYIKGFMVLHCESYRILAQVARPLKSSDHRHEAYQQCLPTMPEPPTARRFWSAGLPVYSDPTSGTPCFRLVGCRETARITTSRNASQLWCQIHRLSELAPEFAAFPKSRSIPRGVKWARNATAWIENF